VSVILFIPLTNLFFAMPLLLLGLVPQALVVPVVRRVLSLVLQEARLPALTSFY
jgi:hypothetical protein